MKKLIAIDPGHGMDTAGKRTPKFKDGTFMKEREFNKAVALYLEELLKKQGFDVLNAAESDTDVVLSARTGLANNDIKNKFNRPADYYISIHANASGDGTSFNIANGIETFIYLRGTGESAYTAAKWARVIHDELIAATGRKNRGLKYDNLHVVRETKMPACLVECGFMTNLEEAELLRSDKYRRTVAEALCKGVCKIFEDASETSVSEAKGGTPILGLTTASAGQAKDWAKSKGAEEWFINLAGKYWGIAQRAGVNPVVVYCQSARETGFGRFGGDVKAAQNNFAGIGATGNGEAGNSFETAEQGIQAQVDHIALYAGALGYPKAETPDPRHFPYLKGTAKTVEELSGKWASDKEYGEGIVKMMKELEGTEAETTAPISGAEIPEWQKTAFETLIDRGTISDPGYWENRIGDTVTIGELFGLIVKL